MNDDEDLKEGLKKSMSEPAKKKKKPEEDEWEEKFNRNRG